MKNLSLPFNEPQSTEVEDALRRLKYGEMQESHGAIYTQDMVVSAILDLVGYTIDKPLAERRILEPSFGNGAFLFPIIRRLIKPHPHAADIANCLLAVEIHDETAGITRSQIFEMLLSEGYSRTDAQLLVDSWTKVDDFLLCESLGQFDYVVGNPPYVRQERIPPALLAAYKQKFSTLYDRADLYVLFYEKALNSLKTKGVLGFICANRWMKNRYGGPLRKKIANGFSLSHHIDLRNLNPFSSVVDSYPAITIISEGKDDQTLVATPKSMNDLSSIENFQTVHGTLSGDDPWLLEFPFVVRALRKLELRLPRIEDVGIRIGIGVASGADAIFIDDYRSLLVEVERKLPLVTSGDLAENSIEWTGKGIINPWSNSGNLVDLAKWPKLASFMTSHRSRLEQRHVARKKPSQWYRTIDKINVALTTKPKLLVPDIKGFPCVVYDKGEFYPHHNLYTVTSDLWDLRALQTILRSAIGLLFVGAYSVRMSGGFLRYQAQYLRRIRVPDPNSLSPQTIQMLIDCSQEGRDIIDQVVFDAYELSKVDRQSILSFAKLVAPKHYESSPA